MGPPCALCPLARPVPRGVDLYFWSEEWAFTHPCQSGFFHFWCDAKRPVTALFASGFDGKALPRSGSIFRSHRLALRYLLLPSLQLCARQIYCVVRGAAQRTQHWRCKRLFWNSVFTIHRNMECLAWSFAKALPKLAHRWKRFSHLKKSPQTALKCSCLSSRSIENLGWSV